MSTMPMQLDPRVKRTHYLIRDALLSLMEEKGFDHVTVRDITKYAEINRATFYLHYEDKYDLLRKMVDGMLDEFAAAFQLPPEFEVNDFVKDANTPPDSFIRQFQHIAEHAAFYRVMLGPNGLPGFALRMESIIRESLYRRSIIAQPNDQHVTMPREIIVRYVTSAHLGIIMYWLENDMKYSPKYMAMQLIRLHEHGSTHFFKGNA
ncbi:TetR/AcrR family transcriptional regulator [Paenibacillus radicis (ex Gao et al. 2016)]|uniref:TetR family transcriptional regulator n=1 Tax=Paenibacillus radicis (ex Gao et al. 2016) TaxID=1737354 RepID=A0A917H4H7_9BACL|nr:TetR/AcrR family transcriptional regulator [Paenibacillus radicis (ex Gao et al. 2016)]GGG67334.1 TetR family transcriptional regulator [Paenibacillus radicis (ex Gao et al. 2016)]